MRKGYNKTHRYFERVLLGKKEKFLKIEGNYLCHRSFPVWIWRRTKRKQSRYEITTADFDFETRGWVHLFFSLYLFLQWKINIRQKNLVQVWWLFLLGELNIVGALEICIFFENSYKLVDEIFYGTILIQNDTVFEYWIFEIREVVRSLIHVFIFSELSNCFSSLWRYLYMYNFVL